MENKLIVAGYFNYEHVRDGKVIDSWQEPNLVVDEGLVPVKFPVVGIPVAYF